MAITMPAASSCERWNARGEGERDVDAAKELDSVLAGLPTPVRRSACASGSKPKTTLAGCPRRRAAKARGAGERRAPAKSCRQVKNEETPSMRRQQASGARMELLRRR